MIHCPSSGHWRGLSVAAVCLGLAAAITIASATAAFADKNCRPKRPLSKVWLTSMGPCAFDLETLQFAGEPLRQAACLTRPVGRRAKLGPVPDTLPAALAERVGRSSNLPARELLSTFLSRLDLEWNLAAFLWQSVAHARDNDAEAPAARYFVIHDTSGPNVWGRWPDNIDENRKINRLARFRCADGWALAHAVINRPGALFVGHDFSVPWRATKFERAVNFGGALKGLFLHVEMIQPRRRVHQAPVPGFTAAQYEARASLRHCECPRRHFG